MLSLISSSAQLWSIFMRHRCY